MINQPYRLSNIIPNLVGVGDFVIERFDFTISQITNIFSTPIVISKGFTTGYGQIPEWAMFVRQGDPYATMPGILTIRCAATAPFNWLTSVTPFLTVAGSRNACFSNCVNANQGAGDELPGALGGKNLEFSCSTNNPTVDGSNPGSPVSIFLCYKIIPIYEQNWLNQANG